MRRASLVRDFLELSAQRDPQKVALVTGTRRLTYGAVDELANRLASGFQALGVRPGDRVMVMLPNSAEAVVALFAASKASGVFSVINESMKPRGLVHLLRDSGSAVLVTDRRRAAPLLAGPTQGELPPMVVLGGDSLARPGVHAYEALVGDGDPSRPPRRARADDLACLIYTSGSTGGPKGVMCGHDNVVFASGSIITYLENTAADVIISGLPLSFDYGLYQLLMAFRFGGRLVLERSLAYPAAVLRSIAAEEVTGLPGVPTFFSLMLRLDLDRFDLGSLRYVTNTAAALPPDHIRTLRKALPDARVYSMYGLTECKRALYLSPDDVDEVPGSVGIPIPGTEAWIVDGDGRRLPAGEPGELVVRGPHVMRGYWRDPALTAAVFRPGRRAGERVLHTGDLMTSDDQGRFYFLSRKDDIIKTRGERVSPKEIEDVLYELPGVVKAAVVGVPDPTLGAMLKAYVVADDPGLGAEDVVRHCRRGLEDYKVPGVVEFRDDLPSTSSGKIQKKGL